MDHSRDLRLTKLPVQSDTQISAVFADMNSEDQAYWARQQCLNNFHKLFVTWVSETAATLQGIAEPCHVIGASRLLPMSLKQPVYRGAPKMVP